MELSKYSMIRVIVFLSCFILLTTNAASPRDWYVRPAGGHYGANNGTSYTNAWNGLLKVIWGMGGVQPGDTLYVCGTHIYQMTANDHVATQAEVKVSGGNGEEGRIMIRGDYPGDPGVVWGAYLRKYDIRYGARYQWIQHPDYPGVWSTELDANLYADWYFSSGTTGYTPLEKGGSFNEVVSRPGTHYSADYVRGSRLYVHLPDNGSPEGRLLFNRWGYRFSLGSNAYVTFSNLEFMAPASFWIGSDRPHHIRFEKCRFFFGETRMFSILDGMDYMEVINCEIAWAGNGIYNISNSNSGAPSHYRFTGNHIHDIGVRLIQRNGDAHAIGIQGGTDGLIADNLMENCGTGPLLYAFRDQVLRNTIVVRNFVRDCHTLGGARGYGISTMCNNDSLSDKSGNTFYQNIVINCPVGYRFQFEHEQKVVNNAAINCAVGLGSSRNFNGLGAKVLLKNNIFMGSRNYHIRWASGATNIKLDSDYNSFYPVTGKLFNFRGKDMTLAGWELNKLKWPESEFDSHSITTKPLFVNSSGKFSKALDFFPAPGSPVIGAGCDVGLLGPTPLGKPDIGPFEYKKLIPPYNLQLKIVK